MGATAPTATQITIPGWLNPGQPVVAPDGDLWLSAQRQLGSGALQTEMLKVTSTGAVVQIVDRDAKPLLIGPDGKLWFALYGAPVRLGTVLPDGRVRLFSPLPGSTLKGATVGPQGNVWFALLDKTGYITPTGRITLVRVTGYGFGSTGISTDTNGYVWLANETQFGWISPAGKTGTVADLSEGPLFADLTGDVWAAFGEGDHIAEVDSNSEAGPQAQRGLTWGPTLNGPGYSSPVALGTAADGHTWFLGDTGCGETTALDDGCIDLIDPEICALSTSGVSTVFPAPISPSGQYPVMTAGPTGELLMSKPTDLTSRDGAYVPENDGTLWAITLPSEPTVADPSLRLTRTVSHSRDTVLTLSCSGQPGRYCFGSITLRASGFASQAQTYAIDPGHTTTYTITTRPHRSGTLIHVEIISAAENGQTMQELNSTTHVVK